MNGEFKSPGLGGDSSAIAGITGTCVRYRKDYNDFVAMGISGNMIETMGYGPRLSFSKDGINEWVGMNSSLLWVDQYSWNREPPVTSIQNPLASLAVSPIHAKSNDPGPANSWKIKGQWKLSMIILKYNHMPSLQVLMIMSELYKFCM